LITSDASTGPVTFEHAISEQILKGLQVLACYSYLILAFGIIPNSENLLDKMPPYTLSIGQVKI
jgi:hypothetical protein